MNVRHIGLAGLLLPALATSAVADTLKVPSDEYPTIQSAIDDATGEDRITVKAGHYRELLFIPGGKDGLELSGAKGTIVSPPSEPELPAPEGVLLEDNLLIQSRDVTVRGMTFRHSERYGIRAVEPEGLGEPGPFGGITLDRVTIVNAAEVGMQLYGDDFVVSGCALIGCSGGLMAFGDGTRITKTRVEHDGERGILVEGDDVRVESCTLAYIDSSDGLGVYGAGAVVSRNKLSNIAEDAIVSEGSTVKAPHVIERNRIDVVGDSPMVVDGNGVRILRNTIDASEADCIEVNGDACLIDGNRLSRGADDSSGVYLVGSDNTISKNRIDDFTGAGLEFVGDNNLVIKNTISRCGSQDEAGIRLDGQGNVVEANRISDCDDSGIETNGGANTFTKNTISSCTDNGIEIDGGTGNVLDGNTVSRNLGDGLDNGGLGTVIRKNRFKGNLQDLSNRTNEGADLIDEGGNVFKTGSLEAEPVGL